MEELLTYIVTSITKKEPAEIGIEYQETSNEHIFTLFVDSLDIGLIIGKKGSVIKAIRQLLSVKLPEKNKRIVIKILPK